MMQTEAEAMAGRREWQSELDQKCTHQANLGKERANSWISLVSLTWT